MVNSLKIPAVTLGLSVVSAILACSPDGKSGFLPENELYISVEQKGVRGGLTRSQFNNAINKVVYTYAPVVASYGARFEVRRKWRNGAVNAYAERSPNEKVWRVVMFGGLARHHAMTEDAMTLIVCHELGHHIGGAPRRGSTPTLNTQPVNKWSSAEGQADYFATLKCLRKVFLNDDNVKIVSRMAVPQSLAQACRNASKNNTEDTAICIRSSMAGKSVATLFSALSRSPKVGFETPDRTAVLATNEGHPKPQCRLDTFVQGAICDVGLNEDVSQTDELKGTCNTALGHKFGARPLCWFKPSI